MLPGNTTNTGQWIYRSASSASGGDGYWSYVSFLTHADGADTAKNSTVVDNSTYATSIAVTGTPIQGTYGPVGSSSTAYSALVDASSIYFNGAGDYLTIASTSNLALGSGNFTIECWYWLDMASLPGNAGLYDQRNGTNGGGVIQPCLELGTTPSGWGWYVAAGYQISSGTAPVKFKQWQHLAVSKSGGTTSMYIDGVRVGTPLSDSFTYPAGSITIARENDGVNTRYLNAYISNLRVVIGTGLYSGTTLTVPTAPLTAIAGTALLLPFTNGGIIDQAKKNNVFLTGNTQVATATPKFGTGSISFNGASGNNMRVLNTAAAGSLYDFSNGSFTIEMWVYPTALPSGTYAYLYSHRTNDGDVTPWAVALYKLSSSLYLTFQGSTSGGGQEINLSFSTYGSGYPMSLNTWYHIAVVRDAAAGGVVTGFVNGAPALTVSPGSGAIVTSTNPVNFGSQSTAGTAASNFTGYLDDIRVTKGVARYSSGGYTVPSAAFPDSPGSYDISSSAGSVNEGSSVVITLTGINIPNGTSIPYSISGTGITASRFTSNSVSGLFTINNGTTSTTIGIANNYVTDGVTTATITVANTSTRFTINDTSLSPTYSLSAPASIDEGSSGTITLTATGSVPPSGFVVPFAIFGVAANRFISPATTSSSFIMGSGSATTTTWLLANATTNGAATMTVRLTNTPAISTSTTINDTSTGGGGGGSSSVLYATAGTYSWTAPPGVTSVSVIAVGGGEGGTTNGTASACGPGGASYFNTSLTVSGGGGASNGGTATTESTLSSSRGGASGGLANSCGGAGGAGGYSGPGGAGGGGGSYVGVAGTGGSGGSGAVQNSGSSGGGGGVGVFGLGANGAAPSGSQGGGGGGSGGGNGGTGGGPSSVGHGLSYGKAGGVGAGTGSATAGTDGNSSANAGGAVATTGGGNGGSSTSNTNSASAGGGGGAFGGGGGTAGCWYRSGAGGALAYINNYPVTPGNSYTVVVGRGGAGGSSGKGGGGGASGAVRIVWPGTTRQFPSTCVSGT